MTTKPLELFSHFIDITDRCTELETIGTDWQNKKNGSKGRTPLGGQTNSFVVGLKGELIYARLVGLEAELNLSYKSYGDGGVDFQKYQVDVKTSTKANPLLIENKTVDADVKSSKHPDAWAKYFVLVRLNEEQTGGHVMGWATKEQLLAARVKEFFAGQGERYFMGADELNAYDTDLNYIFHVHRLSAGMSEPTLAEFFRRRRNELYNQYHADYQHRVKNGLV